MAITDQQQVNIEARYSALAKTERGQSVFRMLEARDEIQAAQGKLWLTNLIYNRPDSVVQSLACWYMWYEDNYGQPAIETALNEYLSRETVKATLCVWIVGIKPVKRHEFGDISLIPLNEMIDSRERDYYRSQVQSFESPVAYGAFTTNIEVPRVVENEDFAEQVGNDLIMPAHESLRDAALLVNGIEELSCLPEWSCAYYSEDTSLGIFLPGGGKSRPRHDVVGTHNRNFSGNHGKLLNEMLELYRDISDEQTKIWLRAILERIRKSKRQRELPNKILDLGIAAEMLLLKDLGERDPISFPFRFRGSWLLGHDFEQRLKTHNLLKKFYEYRCQIAHNGSFEKPKDHQNANQQLPEFYSLVERILQMALRAEYPKSHSDWLELILGKEKKAYSDQQT